MTSPVANPSPPPDAQATEDQVTAAILLVLLSGMPIPDTEAHIVPLLARLGISPKAASDAVALIVPQIEPDSRTPLISRPAQLVRVPAAPTPDGGFTPPSLDLIPAQPRTPAQSYVRTTEVPRHSRYLVAAAKRFQQAQSQEEGQAIMQRERRYLSQHLAAVQRSREAAKRVDNAVQRYGTTQLGWWAHMDSKTTPECAAANGTNFDAAKPPLIGYPGTLHGGTCRCHAGPAHNTLLTVDEATGPLRQNAVLPFASEIG